MLLALVFHLLSEAQPEDFEVRRLAALFFKFGLEFLDTLLGGSELLFDSLSLGGEVRVCLLRVGECSPSWGR